jgi:hypothetical protein
MPQRRRLLTASRSLVHRCPRMRDGSHFRHGLRAANISGRFPRARRPVTDVTLPQCGAGAADSTKVPLKLSVATPEVKIRVRAL